MNVILELHQLFNGQKRFTFPFAPDANAIPQNGIYIIFEKGEKYYDYDRIVRVGTHTGVNQLHSRLNQHFLLENKNRSIFRKNIGRCILNKENSGYMNLWELDTTSRVDKEKHAKLLDAVFEKQIEKLISSYVQANLSFCVIRIDSKEERIHWERKIASTLAQKLDIMPSAEWLGNHSPKEKIKGFGLWQVNELNKEPITETEMNQLKQLLS